MKQNKKGKTATYNANKSTRGIGERIGEHRALFTGLGAVWTACVHYLLNSLVPVLFASLLLMRAI